METGTQPTPRTTPKPIFHTLLVFRCPTTLSEALAQQAIQQRTTVSAVIRELLRAGLKGDGTR